MTLRLVVTTDARHRIDEADLWWFEHRRRTPNRVEEEIARAFSLLVESPGIGSPYFCEDIPNLRRYRLQSTPYYLYYAVDVEAATLTVVTLWSAMRGEEPPL